MDASLKMITDSDATVFPVTREPEAQTESCRDTCAALYKDLKDFVQDDPLTTTQKPIIIHQSCACPAWLWWYFGLTLASFIILFIVGACLAVKKWEEDKQTLCSKLSYVWAQSYAFIITYPFLQLTSWNKYCKIFYVTKVLFYFRTFPHKRMERRTSTPIFN